MEILSVNIGEPQTITWQGKEVKTGIYKYPVNKSIELGVEDVVNDHVIDRKYHGGSDKACYLFSEKHYKYWKNLYPQLDWQWGMFGENITVKDLDETEINIGDIFKLGTAKVQVSQPRQPCFKLGVRFGTQLAVKQFIDYGYAGVYVRVLQTGKIKAGDQMILSEKSEKSFSLKEIFNMLYSKDLNPEIIKRAVSDKYLAESCRNDLKKIWGI